MHIQLCLYLFFVCLYVKFFRVLQCLVSILCIPDPRSLFQSAPRALIQRSDDVRRKFSQLVSDHIFGYRNVHVAFAIVDLELQPDKVR